MQKRVGIIFISLLLVLSVGFVSAGWFGDLWGKITGHAVVNGMNCPDGLIAYFPFDNSTELISGNAVTNSGVTFVPGKIGNAAYFNYNSLTFNSLNLGKVHTISFWLNDSSLTNNPILFSHAGTNNYYFYIRNLNPWNFGFFAGGNSFSAYPDIPNSAGFTGNSWQYVTLVRDGTNMTVYVNGNYAANWVGSNGANNDYTIDRIGGTGTESFKGQLDDLVIYNKALSASEVRVLYNIESNGIPVCTKIQPTCTPNWQCTSWSTCANSQQTRTCSDSNNCGINSGMPITSQSCTMPVTNVTGCCINSIEGIYDKNVPQASCTGTNVTFDSAHPLCDLPGATLGCCIVAGRTIFNTLQACIRFNSIAGNSSSVDWRQINEAQCLLLNQTPPTTCSNLDSFVSNGIAQKMDSYYYLKNFQLKDDVVDINLVYLNSDGNVIGVGKDGSNILRTSSERSLTFYGNTDNYFVASDTLTNTSYLMRATNFKIEFGKVNRTTIQYKNNGSWYDVKQDAIVGDGVYLGNMDFRIVSIDYKNRAAIIIAESGASFSKLYSKDGIVINLPLVDSSGKISCPSFSMPTIVYSGTCSDSDGGKDIYTSGTVKDQNEASDTDFCTPVTANVEQQTSVMEFYCDNGKITSTVIDCPSRKCNNGACISSTNNTTCTPSWSCTMEPSVCPEHGAQIQTCKDTSCNSEPKISPVACNPGTCSGCMIPRWLGSVDDNVCMPYGFRFSQTQSEKNSGRVDEGSSSGTTVKILSDSEVQLILVDPKSNKSYDYTLILNQPQQIYIPVFEKSISSVTLTVTKIAVGENNTGYIMLNSEVARDANLYCNYDGVVYPQKTKQYDGSWAKCQNNYECASNLCSGGECVEINSMIKEVTGYKAMGIKILCKLADMFGVQNYDSCLAGYIGNQTASS